MPDTASEQMAASVVDGSRSGISEDVAGGCWPWRAQRVSKHCSVASRNSLCVRKVRQPNGAQGDWVVVESHASQRPVGTARGLLVVERPAGRLTICTAGAEL